MGVASATSPGIFHDSFAGCVSHSVTNIFCSHGCLACPELVEWTCVAFFCFRSGRAHESGIRVSCKSSVGCQRGTRAAPRFSPRVLGTRQGRRGKRHTARGRAALLSAVVRQHGGNRPCLLHWPIFREGGGQRVPRDRDVVPPSRVQDRPLRCRDANRHIGTEGRA